MLPVQITELINNLQLLGWMTERQQTDSSKYKRLHFVFHNLFALFLLTVLNMLIIIQDRIPGGI